MNKDDIGIIGIELQFPKTYVSQQELEQFDKVSKGKYTIGLGQENMSFTYPFEDINSICLSAVYNLMKKYDIKQEQIGRLSVGTETILDKSKSIKTHLMQLFPKNSNIEGVQVTNACYGGTEAFFNTIDWMQSPSWDGRLAIVVQADIAVYEKGPARPTGGAAAIALLIGPNAQIVFEYPRVSHMENAYDFYKPNVQSEYPMVDGKLSIDCYLRALDSCQKQMQQKLQQKLTNNFDFFCFHTPYSKLVQKSCLRICENENLDKNQQINIWEKQCLPSLYFSKNLGNIYTGALMGCLISLLTDQNIQMKQKKVLMFSYGSGLASSMFILNIKEPNLNISDIRVRLQQRMKISPSEYDQIMEFKQKRYLQQPPLQNQVKLELYKVQFDKLFHNTFYLNNIDEKWRRKYQFFDQTPKL